MQLSKQSFWALSNIKKKIGITLNKGNILGVSRTNNNRIWIVVTSCDHWRRGENIAFFISSFLLHSLDALQFSSAHSGSCVWNCQSGPWKGRCKVLFRAAIIINMTLGQRGLEMCGPVVGWSKRLCSHLAISHNPSHFSIIPYASILPSNPK